MGEDGWHSNFVSMDLLAPRATAAAAVAARATTTAATAKNSWRRNHDVIRRLQLLS